MAVYWYRGEKCKICNNPIPVFALGHYVPTKDGEDLFSRNSLYFYKYGYYESDFFNMFVELYKTRNDINFDMVCLVPTSEKDTYNNHLSELITKFSQEINVPYVKLLIRNRSIKKQHELYTKEERIANVKDSISISENQDVAGKNILVIDNTSIYGSHAKEIHRLLIHEKKANNCVFMCIALGIKAKDADFDINKRYLGKFSDMIKNWHWPKVSRKNRDRYNASNK